MEIAGVGFSSKKKKEIQYIKAEDALTDTDIVSENVLYGYLTQREISIKDVFSYGDSSKKFKIAEGQWYCYAPSYVSPAYHLLEGFPFIQEPPSGDLQERVFIRHHDFFFSSRRRHTILVSDWSSDVCSSDLIDLCWRHWLSKRLSTQYQSSDF